MILLPVKPCFAYSIVSGEKEVEFRKRRLNKEITHVVIYASHPIKKVIGYFEISALDEGKPHELWSKYKHVSGLSHEDFETYYSNSDFGVAIKIKKAKKLEEPMALSNLGESLNVPQNYMYISDELFDLVVGSV